MNTRFVRRRCAFNEAIGIAVEDVQMPSPRKIFKVLNVRAPELNNVHMPDSVPRTVGRYPGES